MRRAGVDGSALWFDCACGARIARRADLGYVEGQNLVIEFRATRVALDLHPTDDPTHGQ